MITFLSHFLFILAAWTLTIKFFFPMGYAISHGLPLGTHIYWDFWWVIHLWLGWALLKRPRYTFPLAIVVSVAEVLIVVTKFTIFLAAPDWTIWSTNWFINKVFVLACFTLLLSYCLLNGKALRNAASSLQREALT